MIDVGFGRKTHFMLGNGIWTDRKLAHRAGEL